jgi:putative flippase GtrA
VPASRIADRPRHLAGEGVRFLAVGGLATAVAVLGFNALLHGTLLGFAPMRDQPIPAYVLANIAGGAVAYAGMRLWAFSHREVPTSAGVLMFVVLGVATMAIPVLFLTVSRYLLGLESQLADNISANVLGLGLGTISRFWLFRRYVFPHAGGPVSELRAA